MIVGIGVDLVELDRIKDAIEKGDRLASRVLTKKEFALYETYTSVKKAEFLGGRFAAKEAVSKAFGTGIGTSLSFDQIEVLPNAFGAPQMTVSSPHFDCENLRIHLSISHSQTTAIAQVVLEK